MSCILLTLIQCVLLAGGQVLLKFALEKMGDFSFTFHFFVSQLTNWWLLSCGICYGVAAILWMYIVKHFPLSTAYPMLSLSYVFGMLAAMFFFNEQISGTKWIGVAMIVFGYFLVAK